MQDSRYLVLDELAGIEACAAPIAAASGRTVDELYADIGFDPVHFQFAPDHPSISRDYIATGVVEMLRRGRKPDRETGLKSIVKSAALGAFIVGAAIAGAGQSGYADNGTDSGQDDLYGKLSEIVNLAQKTDDPYKTMDRFGRDIYSDVTSFVPSYFGDLFPSDSTQTPAPEEPVKHVKEKFWLNLYNETDSSTRPGIGRENATAFFLYLENQEGIANATLQKMVGKPLTDPPKIDAKNPVGFTYLNRAERVGDLPLKEAQRALNYSSSVYGKIYNNRE